MVFVRSRTVVVTLMLMVCAATAGAQRNQTTPVFDNGPWDVKSLGIGKRATALIVLGDASCKECIASMNFYKSLMKLPGMDGKARLVIVIAKDGVWPVKTVTDAHGFIPHLLNSGPYVRRPVPGVTKAPTILVLDGKGIERGRWAGLLTPAQQKEVIAVLTK